MNDENTEENVIRNPILSQSLPQDSVPEAPAMPDTEPADMDSSVLPGMDDFAPETDSSVLPGMDDVEPMQNTYTGIPDLGGLTGNDETVPGMIDDFSNTGNPYAQGFDQGMADPMASQMGAQVPVEEPTVGMGPTFDPMYGDVGMEPQEEIPMTEPQGMGPDMGGMDNGNFGGDVPPSSNPGFESSNSGDVNMDFVRNWMQEPVFTKAHSSKFNICAALFGPFYFIYRKMYAIGGLVLVLSIIFSFIASFLTSKGSIAAGGALGFLYFIAQVAGCGLGFYPLYRSFVKGQLDKYKKTTQDENQLLAIANQKGGVSILGLIIAILVEVITSVVIMTVTIGNAVSGVINQGMNALNTMANSLNTIQNQVAEEDFVFDECYVLTYDGLKWFEEEDDNGNKSLTTSTTDSTYALQFNASYDGAAFGDIDMTDGDTRSLIYTTFVNQFQQMAQSNGYDFEVGSNNFVINGKMYYTYIDFTNSAIINRFYVVLLPEENKIMQFMLATDSLSIDYTINLDVIRMLGTIKYEDELANAFTGRGNTVSNTLENTVAANEVGNSITTNTVTNQVVGNSVTTNTVDTNTTSGIPLPTANTTAQTTANTITTQPVIEETTTQSTQSTQRSVSTLGLE